MWPFRTKKPDPQDTPKLRDRVAALEILVADLEHEVKIVHGKHLKLSGAYYRRFGAGDDQTTGQNSESLTKAQLRAKLGLFPGKPTNLKG